MIFLNMACKATFDCSFENQILEIAYVASIVRIEIVLTFLVTQLCKRVDDNTEDNVQTDNVHDDLEASIVHQFE